MCFFYTRNYLQYVTSLDELVRIAENQTESKYNLIVEVRTRSFLVCRDKKQYLSTSVRILIELMYIIFPLLYIGYSGFKKGTTATPSSSTCSFVFYQFVFIMCSMSSDDSDVKALLKERGALHTSLQMADSYLEQLLVLLFFTQSRY